jgi:hypothetical protein
LERYSTKPLALDSMSPATPIKNKVIIKNNVQIKNNIKSKGQKLSDITAYYLYQPFVDITETIQLRRSFFLCNWTSKLPLIQMSDAVVELMEMTS